MIKPGDILICKDEFMLQCNIPEEHREAKVVSYKRDELIVEIGGKQFYCHSQEYIQRSFTVLEHCNQELLTFIKSGINFKCFVGVTVEGKTISIGSIKELIKHGLINFSE